MNHDNAMRPTTLDTYHGQPALVAQLRVKLMAAKARGEISLPHVLLYGPGGLGKTTLAGIIANELGSRAHIAMGPALETRDDIFSLLWQLGEHGGDVLFIDEIHRLKPQVAEILYTVLEDGAVYYPVTTTTGTVQAKINLKPFTLIGATTQPELLEEPMRMRFGTNLTLRFYSPADLARIIKVNAAKLSMAIDSAALRLIAERSRGTPRVANHLLKFARDLASIDGTGITLDVAERSLEMQGIDSAGLGERDRDYLRILIETYEGRPVGAQAIAATIGCKPGEVASVIEPYMLQSKLIERTNRGRRATAKAIEHMRKYDAAPVELFAA